MLWKNTERRYGLPAVLIHWLTVLTVFSLFGLGLWMRELDYYDSWYKTAPNIHKSVGIVLFVLTLVRLGWMLFNPKPLPPAGSPAWERGSAKIVHCLLYWLLFAVMISGYLISTADGRGIAVFGGFEIPALPWTVENQEEIAGEIHKVLAFSLIGLAVLHALAAFKHQFVNKDGTLRRMFF